MTTNLFSCCLHRRMKKLKITSKRELKINHTDQINNNMLSKRIICRSQEKTEEVLSLDENTLHRVPPVELLNFKSLEATSQPLKSRSEVQENKRDKHTRSWMWVNLDWEGSLTIETSSTSSSELWESQEYYEYIPPIEDDEDPTEDEKIEMIKKWLFKSETNLNKS